MVGAIRRAQKSCTGAGGRMAPILTIPSPCLGTAQCLGWGETRAHREQYYNTWRWRQHGCHGRGCEKPIPRFPHAVSVDGWSLHISPEKDTQHDDTSCGNHWDWRRDSDWAREPGLMGRGAAWGIGRTESDELRCLAEPCQCGRRSRP